jgi:SAM-dependent methyltransferase
MDVDKFESQFAAFTAASRADGRFNPIRHDLFKCLEDDTTVTGYDPHYVLHAGWAARKLAILNPETHHDFGGSMYFVAIVSAFIKEFYFHDIRDPNLPLRGIDYLPADLTALPFPNDSLSSMSCLHVLEHVGLGRYGDALDPAGDRKAARELARVLHHGGELLIAVPMEEPSRVQFNAHRLYSYDQVLQLFSGLTLQEFSLITNDSKFIQHAHPSLLKNQKYACGCFRFTKP